MRVFKHKAQDFCFGSSCRVFFFRCPRQYEKSLIHSAFAYVVLRVFFYVAQIKWEFGVTPKLYPQL